MAKSTLSLQIDSEGHIIVAAPLADARVLVAKFAPDGALVWERAESVSSAGEPAEADDPARDSFAPMLVDADSEGHPQRLHRAQRRGRLATRSVLGAAALTLLLAAVGLGRGETSAPQLQRFTQPVTALAARSEPLEVAGTDWIAPEDEAAVTAAGETSPEATSSPVELPVSGPMTTPRVFEERVSEEPKPQVEPEPELTDASAYGTGGVLALRRDVLNRLTTGDDAQSARLAAQTLVMNSPSDAFGYLCLGAALDQLGMHAEAMSTYLACAEVARLGDVAECRALLARPAQ